MKTKLLKEQINLTPDEYEDQDIKQLVKALKLALSKLRETTLRKTAGGKGNAIKRSKQEVSGLH